MQTFDRLCGLVHELGDETTVVDSVVLLHGALDRDSFLVDDYDTKYAHMRIDAIQRFFHLLRRCHS